MVEISPRCPDCSVEMEQMTLSAGGYNLRFVSEESTEGILGSLGVKEKFDADAFVCPECGLSRLYADIDD
jgi:rubredoxin